MYLRDICELRNLRFYLLILLTSYFHNSSHNLTLHVDGSNSGMNFLQSQPETEVVDSAFDFHFVRKPLVTVTNHSNKYIRLKGDCVLSKFLPIQELVNSTDA